MATSMSRVSTAGSSMASSPMSDEEVVKRVCAGETALFEILMRRHNQRLYRAARAILGNDGEAEEVMQEAYVRAYIHLKQFDGRAKFSTWLTKIAVHEALARCRQRCRMVELDRGRGGRMEWPMKVASKSPSPEQEVLTQRLRKVLEEAIERLPENYRTVFVLRQVEGLSTAETGEYLSLSEESVRVRWHRARAYLRKKIFAQTGAATAEDC
jgi:RNA polymerase sigma-70 factor (ECF subfamily)